MYTVYLIGTVRPGFFYVGYSKQSHYEHRIEQHTAGRGAEFTKRHGVLWCTTLEENIATKEEAKRLEWQWVLRLRSCQCVCGGGSSSPDLRLAAAA